MLFAAIHSEGEMSASELRLECPKKDWLPLLVMRPKGDKETLPTLLTFTSEEVCLRFYKRNFPKNWKGGWVSLDPVVLNMLSAEGWSFRVFNYPNKVNISIIDLTLEVVYFPEHQDYQAYIPC